MPGRSPTTAVFPMIVLSFPYSRLRKDKYGGELRSIVSAGTPTYTEYREMRTNDISARISTA